MSQSSNLSKRRADLSPAKQALLEKLKRGTLGTRLPGIVRHAEQGPAVLSFAQQRVWFLDQLVPGSAAYNIPAAVRLNGRLDVATLHKALNALVQRHESLRTTFALIDEQPRQVVASSLLLPLPLIDLEAVTTGERREAEMLRLASEEAQRPFDLHHGPLVRSTLLRLAPDEHVLLLTLHHSIADGWSVAIAFRELATLYAAFTAGKPSPLPDLPVQYTDFARWQRGWLQGEALETQLAYWRERLVGASTVLELPTDRPRPAIQSFRGAQYSFSLPQMLTEPLKAFARQEGVTLFMTLLAAFQVLLWRYTNQDDLLIGTPIANRTRAEVEGLIGFFANTLVLRNDLSGNPTIRELLRRVREATLGAYAHQDLPFEKLIEELAPERDLSRNPLFQVMFLLQNAPGERLELGDLRLSWLETHSATTKFDLWFALIERPEGLLGTIEYSTDLFDEATIARMAAHYQRLLESMVAAPEQRLSELPLLTEPERHQVLLEWNHTRRAYPSALSLHQLFEAQVEQTPDAVALVYEGQPLTYRELNARSNQLAHYLQGLGVGPEVVVGLCLERSLELLVGVLGILKAGGAYLPLDPEYPRERLAFMLADAQTRVLLTEARLQMDVSEQQARVVLLDDHWPHIAQEPTENPTSSVASQNLAYVIYTSGSTGRPKGVMNTHAGICNRLQWMQEMYHLTEADRVLQKTPFSFDVSVWEFFWPLLAGAQLIVARPGGHRDSAYLIQLIEEQAITTLHFVPSMLRLFLEEPALERCGSLKRVLCSGEALSFELQERFFSRFPLPVELHNLYGPTEAAIDVTSWACSREATKRVVPIGRPIANMQVYLLDSHLQLVPSGVPGELYIGGIGLARGYLHRPELTAERFVPHPFSTEPGARLYRTGDLARYLPDGAVEFLGRLDQQVKLRGYRIELGEIEAVLSQQPTVQECAVTLHEDAPDHKQLVAYIVPRTSAYEAEERLRDDAGTHLPTHQAAQWRAYTNNPLLEKLMGLLIPTWHHSLKEWLPEYMVPAIFVGLDALPLFPNGKLDRQALPAPPQAMPELEASFVAPRTPVEETLARIWAEVLEIERVGVRDNFFELGGDSIRSIQIVSRARQTGLQLTPKHLFQHQTIAELAEATEMLPTIQEKQEADKGPVPLTPAQHWFLEQEALSDLHHWNQTLLLEVRQALDPVLLQQAVQHLLRHHDALRLRFTFEAGGWQQFTADQDEVLTPLTLVDLSTLPETEQGSTLKKLSADLQSNANLAEGPLLQVVLFDLGKDQPDRLLLVIHRLVADECSWPILLEDLQTAYQHLCRGEAVHLPAKTTSFQQWSQRLSQYRLSPALRQELSFWLAELREQTDAILVDDASGSEGKAEQTVEAVLGAEETSALLQTVAKVPGIQVSDVLLTALAQTFAWWRGNRSLLLTLVGNGREASFTEDDLSRTIGCFSTPFPLYLRLGESEAPGESLQLVKEQLRRIPNQGIGYGLLRYLSGDAEVQQSFRALPQASVRFMYRGQLDKTLSSSLFSLAPEFSGLAYKWPAHQGHLLDIYGCIAKGQLCLQWMYNDQVYSRSTIEELAQRFIQTLQGLILHCQSPEMQGYTPSDFPLARLDQKTLNRLSEVTGAIEDIYPLAPMQQSMLSQYLKVSQPGLYMINQIYLFKGIQIDRVAFQRAWQQVINWHPVLRSSFVWEGLEEPLQVVHPQASLPVEEQDWQGLSTPEQEERLEAYLERVRGEGFDLKKAPQTRLALFQVAKDAYRFVWSFNYMLEDGWSYPLIFKGFFDCYEALAHKQDLPPRPQQHRPFRDYIAWYKQHPLSSAEAFWRKQLEGFTVPTPLRIEWIPRRSPRQEKGYVKQSTFLSVATTTSLRALARQQQLTLNTFFQGAWALLLSHYSGQEDVVFGSIFSGRPAMLAGVEQMVGPLNNLLPVRVRVQPEASVISWLKDLQAQQVETRQYEYTPLMKIKEWLGVPPEIPLFNSYLVFENFPMDISVGEYMKRWGSNDIRALARTEHMLRVEGLPTPSLLLTISYYQRDFEPTTIDRMLENLRTTLESMVAKPEQRLRALKQCLEGV